jgi:alkaline phosphatase D
VQLSRRNLLIGAAGLAVAPRIPRRHGDPFTLGVASGDPTPDGVVLWTRLAPRPLAEDGHGGMPSRDTEVEWQLAEDERFTSVVRSGTVTARASWAHSVHVEPAGLQPGREYFYRTLTDYRRRHAQYKTDADLRALHALAPWIAVNDDHEVENNWAGSHAGTSDRPGFAERKRAGYRAYYEHMPLRRASMPRGSRIQLYRRLGWGSLATFHVLDTRQFRADQPCDDGIRLDCDERLATGRVLAGPDQRRWLAAGLRSSAARWNLLAQQIFMAQHDYHLGPGKELLVDTWDGYVAERRRVLGDIAASGARNPVVLTGDIHAHYASDLLADFDDPASRRVGVELVTTSITSDGDGYDDPAGRATELAENPHIAYADQRRGYVVCRLSAQRLRAEFHTLPYVSRRNAPSTVTASFTVEDGPHRLTRSATPAPGRQAAAVAAPR